MENKSASMSADGKYRYSLGRVWDENLPLVMFIMLNPSTADHTEDDPTIRKCRNFAKFWGYGGIVVCNLFPYRATKPEDLMLAPDPTHVHNSQIIDIERLRCSEIVYAWGNTPVLRKLFKKFPDYRPLPTLMEKVHYIELSKDGAPKHPLYLAGNKQLTPYAFHETFAYLNKQQ